MGEDEHLGQREWQMMAAVRGWRLLVGAREKKLTKMLTKMLISTA